MNCCLQNYTIHQFTYFIYYLFQDKIKNPKIIKIQQVHQKLHTKQFLLFYLNRGTNSRNLVLSLESRPTLNFETTISNNNIKYKNFSSKTNSISNQI